MIEIKDAGVWMWKVLMKRCCSTEVWLWGGAVMGSYVIDSWEAIGTLKEVEPQGLEPVPSPFLRISLSLLSAMTCVAVFTICSCHHILPHHCPATTG